MSRPGGDNPKGRQAIWAIVPIKSFDAAKKRLAGMLSATERRALMLAMARDVLTALSKSSRLAGVLIVSRSPEADALAESFGAARFTESHSANLPGALEEAAAHAVACHDASGIFIIPADVPLISADEIDEMLETHRGVTLLPDGEQVGTNGLICSPPDVIELVFDGRSFEPHRRRAVDAGIEPAIVTDSGFVLDVDRPRDLARLLRLGQDSQTASYLERSGIAQRLRAGFDRGNPSNPDNPDKQPT